MRTEHSLEHVQDGELAFHLQEFDEFSDGLLVRWQEVMVLHQGACCHLGFDPEKKRALWSSGSHPCKHYEPLGPSMAFKCGPVRVLATVTDGTRVKFAGDTAGDLRGIAESYRMSGFMEEVLEEKAENSTLFNDWVKFREMKKQLARTHSRTLQSLRGYVSAVN